ncbi:MAG TPA: DUF2950 domain-containing protein [Bryobacteraceae bacterium]|nr:DUF2950 domain-containing protein [Bryobacteraceae bacterium]
MRTPTLLTVWFAGVLAALSLPAQTPAAQPTFATPEEAIQAIGSAAENNDSAAMLKLLGPAAKDLVAPASDAGAREDRANFARMLHEKLQVDRDSTNPNRVTFTVGKDDWPFPVPLVRNKAGKWHFDTAQGKMEVLARHIGRNELNAIEVCRGYVEAQMEYANVDRDADGNLEYAQKIVSSRGRQDGLYWEGQPGSLVPKSFALAAEAAATAGGKRQPYHGYYYRILKAQGPDAEGGAVSYVVKGEMIGGFALVAWPAEYGASGVKTFIVNHKGIVYEKDLGPSTGALARQMTQFNPDKTWHAVEKE